MEPTATSQKQGFSLIQGMIVGVLLAIIGVNFLPVYAITRPVSGKTACISNIKQLATGQLIYSTDYDEAIPPYYTFDGSAGRSKLTAAIFPYIKNNSVLLCSESARFKADRNNSSQEIDYEHFPRILKHLGKGQVIWLDKIANPAKVAWMHDPVLKISKINDGEEIETNHKRDPNGFVVSFFDGHVKFVPTLKKGTAEAMNTDGVWLK